jgi:choline dehydrogenase
MMARRREQTGAAQFGFIIVGAGSSGCVLANRLSANPAHQVLLIEAGPRDTSPFITMPRGFGKLLTDPKLTWVYQVNKTGGHNEPEYWVRGKVIGGSSSVNGMVYVRGQPHDYDSWEQDGCVGWGWKDLRRCFVAMEDHELGASPMRGAGGPLKVSLHPDHSPVLEAIITSASSLGFPAVEDVNSADGDAFGYQPRTIWRGRRQSAAVAFLRPVHSRPNLTIITDAEVLRINFEGTRATGVRLRDAQGEHDMCAHREVLITAGALNSPKLLQLSGIGPASALRDLGIAVVADVPSVGANMREHRLLMSQWRLRSGSQNAQFNGWGLAASVLRYAMLRRGALTSAAFEVGGYVRTRPELDRPDAQLGMGPMSIDRSKPGFIMEDQPGALCGGYVMRPESQGTVMITSADPAAPLAIDPNYLATESDRRKSVDLFRLIRRLFAQPALAPFVVGESWPGTDIERDDEIIDAFHRIGASGYHAAGTCRMGADAASVVDPQLRVRGVTGLRVCDISVMPSLVSGNTNAPAMAMAWRASELILA